MSGNQLVLVGGAGAMGAALVDSLAQYDVAITVVDRAEPEPRTRARLADFCRAEVLHEPVELPPGRVVLVTGTASVPRRHAWTTPMSTAMLTARLRSRLAGRAVTLLSSVAVYGRARGRLDECTPPELALSDETLRAWCDEAVALAGSAEPQLDLARRLVSAAGPSWTFGQSKRAQELLLADAHAELTVFRLADVFGPGRPGTVADLTARALLGRPLVVADARRSVVAVADIARLLVEDLPAGCYNVGQPAVSLSQLAELVRSAAGTQVPIQLRPPEDGERDSEVASDRLTAVVGTLPPLSARIREYVSGLVTDGGPRARPPIEVVVPPRPERPELVARRQQTALWSGRIKHGNEWTERLTEALRAALELPPERALLLTTSGTEALRLALRATVGPARPGEVAVLPSFTFNATGEVLRQLGYRLVFCEVDEHTWTLDPAALTRILSRHPARVVVAVDSLGNPCDYRALREIRDRFGTVLVADSAPALGAEYEHRPVGTQADAHAFSMSFAKVVSAGGAGGAVVLPADVVARLSGAENWLRSALLPELAAIVALDGVEELATLVARRQQIATVYAELADRQPGLVAQQVAPGNRHAWVHWTMRVPAARRSALIDHLAERGIGTKPYYAPLLHRLDWQGQAEPARLPVTDTLGDEVLALPMSSELTVAQAELIASCVDWFLGDR